MSQTSDLNKAAISQFFTDGIGNSNLGVIAALLSPDFQNNGVATSVQATQTWVQGLHTSNPGLVMSIEQILAEDDLVALRWRMDVPANGATPASCATATNIISMIGGQAVANVQTPPTWATTTSVAPAMGGQTVSDAPTPTPDQNQATINQFFIDGIGNADMSVIAALLSPDYQYNCEASSVADNQAWVQGLHVSCPGLIMSIEQILAEDNLVALRWRMDVPANGANPATYATATNIISMIGGQALTNIQTPAHPTMAPVTT